MHFCPELSLLLLKLLMLSILPEAQPGVDEIQQEYCFVSRDLELF